MAKNNKHEDLVDVVSIENVQETINKTEQFFEKNKNIIFTVGGALLGLLALVLFVKLSYIPGLEKDAKNDMYKAEQYFGMDSLTLAINGDGTNMGFKAIADEYSWTSSGNLANYYLGLCYFGKGEYDNAIAAFEDFKGNDLFLPSIALGKIGDCYLEKGNKEEAIAYYEKAVNKNENALTTPTYLFRAGKLLESTGKKEAALEKYNAVKNDYPASDEAKDIEKFIARASAQ